VLFYTLGQSRIFLTMLYAGLLAGVYVSIDAALRRLFEAGWFLALVMDLLLGAVLALIVIAGLLLAAEGELRLYSLLGTLCGFLIYMGTLHPLLERTARLARIPASALIRWLGRRQLIKKLFK